MTLDEDVKKAVEVMRQGGVILYPTDTIWGIGCDATNEEAVRRVFEIKKRADSKALICLVDSPDRVQRYVREVPAVAWDLAPNLLAEDGSVGIRVTREEVSNRLCYRFQKPIVSTSANVSGEPSAACFAEISEEIRGAVDYIMESRQKDTRKCHSSSIIKLGVSGEIQIIRK